MLYVHTRLPLAKGLWRISCGNCIPQKGGYLVGAFLNIGANIVPDPNSDTIPILWTN